MFFVPLIYPATPAVIFLAAGIYYLGLDPVAAVVSFGGCLFWLAVFARFSYKKRILVNPKAFKISSEKLPTDRVYIGRGFIWRPDHTYIMTRLVKDHPEIFERHGELGGLPVLHGIGGKDSPVYIDLDALRGHVLIIGTTQVGKTRVFELLISHAIKRGDAVVIIDPKGDRGLLNCAWEECIKNSRKEDFAFFSLLHPSFSKSYNPLQNFTLTNEIADRVVSILPAGGDSEPFRNFSWKVANAIVDALLYLNVRPTLHELHHYSLVKMEEIVEKCIRETFTRHQRQDMLKDCTILKDFIQVYKRTPEVHENIINEIIVLAEHPKDHYSKMVTSLSPVLQKLCSGEVGKLLTKVPADIDWARSVRKRQVVYMQMGSMSFQATAEAVMRMTLQDLTSYIGERYAYTESNERLSIFVDEFNEAVYSGFITLLNKAGGANVNIYLATQSIADLQAKLKDRSLAQQIMDNTNVKIWLRCTDIDTASFFTNAVGMYPIKTEARSVSYSPDLSESETSFNTNRGYSVSDTMRNLVEPSWLLRLSRGQGFMLTGGKLYKIRFPLLKRKTDLDYLKEIGARVS